MQPGLDFDRDVNLPVSGRTPVARQASATGAQAAAVVRGRRVVQLLAAFRAHGRLTIGEASTVTGIKESSVCSCWSRLEAVGWIEETGECRSYTTSYGRVVRQAYHRLTARGREAATAPTMEARS